MIVLRAPFRFGSAFRVYDFDCNSYCECTPTRTGGGHPRGTRVGALPGSARGMFFRVTPGRARETLGAPPPFRGEKTERAFFGEGGRLSE